MTRIVLANAGRPTPVWEGTTFVTQFQIHDLIGGAPLQVGDTVYGTNLSSTGNSDTIQSIADDPGAGPDGFAYLTNGHVLSTANNSTIQCTISGTTLTVIACRVVDEVLDVGMFIFTDSGGAAGYIVERLTGTGGAGDYRLSESSTVSTPAAMWTQWGWLVPADWSPTNNSVQLWGSGGNGGVGSSGLSRGGGGGGGGAWAIRSNISLTPGAYVAYQVGYANHLNNSAGGGGSWFNGTDVDTAGSSKVSARGGGTGDDTGIGNGGGGGNTGVGATVHAGGTGGAYAASASGGGGGGAAGSGGVGAGGSNGASGAGGAGGAGGDGAVGGSGADSSTASTAGADGSTSPVFGAGSGGGAGANDTHFNGADGGKWGGGGAGSATDGLTTNSAGSAQNGGIVINYTPRPLFSVYMRRGKTIPVSATVPLPDNQVQPSVIGEGAVDTYAYPDFGTWIGGNMTFSLQWTLDGDDVGNPSANSPYLIQSGDVGKSLGFTLTATNVGGSTIETSTTITVSGPPTPGATANFGINTLGGFGGVPSGQVAGSAITGTGHGDWAIDATGNLVPSAAYGAPMTFSKTAGQSYSLTYADTSTVTVTLQAAKAHFTATPSDTSSAFQLKTLLLANLGGSLVGRDSHTNPQGALWRVKVPAAGWSAVTVISENPATGDDANGNTNRGGGCKIGCLAFDCSLFPEASGPVPVTFESITFTVELDVVHSNFLGYTSSLGYGVSQTKCRFANTDNVSLANVQYGFDNRGGLSQYGHFYRVFRGHTGGMISGASATRIWDNVFENMASDANTLTGTNLSVLRNFAFNFLFKSGAHPDSCQHLGIKDRNLTGFGEVAYNIWVRNTGQAGISDAQGDFFDDTVAPFTISGAHVHHEIMLLTSRNNVVTTRFLAPEVNNCLCLFPLGNDSGSTLVPTISVSGAVSVATVTDCVANAFSLGTGTGLRNTTLAKVLADYQTALPNFTSTTNPAITNRQAALDYVTPANLAVASGGFKNPDNTWRGPLKSDGTYTDA